MVARSRHTQTTHDRAATRKAAIGVPFSPKEAREFTAYEAEFRNECQLTYAKQGLDYKVMRPIYQYGYHLGRDPRFRDGIWSEVEPRIRREWEAHQRGPWERFKDAVRFGWERAAYRH